MKLFKTGLAIFAFLLASSFTYSQEMKAEKYENPEWVNMSYIKFKPMKKDAAMGIIENYFVKADQDAGIDAPTTYHFPTGDYDMLVIWDLPEGLETLNYKMTPDDVKWMKSMAKVAGAQDKAMAKLDEFMTYVEDWKNIYARKE